MSNCFDFDIPPSLVEIEDYEPEPFDLVCADNQAGNKFNAIIASQDSKPKSYVNPAVRYISSLDAKSSQSTTINILNNLAKCMGFEDLHKCPWEDMNYDVVQFILRNLKERELAPTTINSYMNAIKQTMQHAFYDELIEVKVLSRIKGIKQVRGERISKGRKIESSEIRALLDTCSQSKKHGDIRDAAIICMMRGCGLRRAEVPALKYDSIDKSNKLVKVLGKGNKERMMQIPDQIYPIIERWMTIVDKQDWRGKSPTYLFMPSHKSGRLLNKRLGDSSIRYILDQRISKANIDRFSPHDMRRTFATTLLENNREMSDVQLLMGHSDIRTTIKYDLRNKDRLYDISKKMEIF